jgi:Family of unknown function (DUF6448)
MTAHGSIKLMVRSCRTVEEGRRIQAETEKHGLRRGLDGPVVLIWVQKPDEGEIKMAFEYALAVRKLSAEARELADRYFFETLVRTRRAGERASFTGLKPAGGDLGPAIPAADKAFHDGKVDGVLKLLTDNLERGVREHFEKAKLAKDFDKNDVEAGRNFVKAYVEYIHCIEALYRQATSLCTAITTKESRLLTIIKSDPTSTASPENLTSY